MEKNFDHQIKLMQTGSGFIAALDESGGSTPRKLQQYGIDPSEFEGDETRMFEIAHAMRTRIMTDDSFSRPNILGTILFEDTLDREVEGMPTTQYLLEKKGILPFLKIDSGLADPANGVQMMKPIPDLERKIAKALENDVFGTKMRSVILENNEVGIAQIVHQQFEIAQTVSDAGLVPIIEPEVDINCPDKAAAEQTLKTEILAHLEKLDPATKVIFKLTLPEESNFYAELADHSNVLRVVALSGGYPRQEANRRLAQNKGVIASFSRALAEDLSVHQSDSEFSAQISANIAEIAEASAA